MAIRVRMISVALVLALLASVVAPAFAPKRSDAFLDLLLTIGAVIAGGHMAQGLVDDTIDKAEGAAKDIMQQASQEIQKLIQQLETTYGNALNTTLDSLDAFTGQQLAKIATLFDQINQQLLEDVDVIQQAVLDLLQQVNQMIQQTLTQLQDLIVVAVRGATFVIDKTTYNAAFLIAVILLAIGLLVFTKLLFSGKVPQGGARIAVIGFMAFYILLFTGLLIPQSRVYAITMVGQGDKLKAIGPGARIFTVTPANVTKGATVDLTLIGANYGAGGAAAPKVLLAGQELTPKAWSDNQVIVSISGSLSNLDGPQSIAVKTADGKQSSPAIVEFVAPPPPAQLMSWRLVPSGRAYDYRQFGPVNVACVGQSFGFYQFDKQIKVDTGWELATDDAHRGNVDFNTPGNVPNPPNGFNESNVQHSGGGTIQRSIGYLPSNDAQVKTGIEVAGGCLAPFGGSTRWSADYTVWGRKLGPKDGIPVTGSVCSAQGLHKCGTYPADKLAMFKDGRPDNYSLMVTIRTPSGQTVDRSAVFTPGTPGQKLTVENVAVWMENNDLWVKGPGGGYRVPPFLQPIRPAPIKKLPIFHS